MCHSKSCILMMMMMMMIWCGLLLPIEMPFLTHVGPTNHVLDEGQDRTNPLAAKLLCTLFCTS